MKQKRTQKPSQLMTGCVVVITGIFLCIGVFFFANYLSTGQERALARAICDEYGCNASELVRQHSEELRLCEMPSNDDIRYSIVCLEGYGVDALP